MSRFDQAPWVRGCTYYNGGPIDQNNLGGANYEGKEYEMEFGADDLFPAGTTYQPGRLLRVRVVRNKSTIPLKPKRIARYRLNADSPIGTAVDGYTTGVADLPAGIIDEFLPAAGVPVGDLFYVVVSGPTTGTAVQASLTTLAIGDTVVAGTGTSSVSSDAGCLQKQDATATGAALFEQIQNRVGRSDQAQATAGADTALVVQMETP